MTATSSQRTALYRAYDHDKRLLYVGISGAFGRRLHQHAADSPWFAGVASVTVEHYPDRARALAAEAAAIAAEKPVHNVIHSRMGESVPANGKPSKQRDRVSGSSTIELRKDSLVGSFFLAGPRPGWQGCVVAEPVPGVYLVETFDWVIGTSHSQRLVRIEEMGHWLFFDDAEWMRNSYDNELGYAWKFEREATEVPLEERVDA